MKPYLKFSSKEKKLLQPVYRFAKAKKIKLYIVGGILRDILLGREKENPDIDFCLKKGAINFGRQLSREIKAGFVVLDKEHGACRLVKRIKNKTYTLDLTDFRGKTLEDDLLHRDFTINAIALDLGKVFVNNIPNDLLIDPCGGIEDLQRKIIKVVNKKSFSEDPLRILRAFSFACRLGFNVEPETSKLAKLEKGKLSQVSNERVRDELFKIFDSPCTFNYLVTMDKLKILKIIFPEIEKMRGIGQGPYHHLDVWQHTLETVRQLEVLIDGLKNNKEIQDYLNDIISSERRRYALIKLGAFLHDVGKPQAMRHKDGKTIFHGHESIGARIVQDISRRLRLSNDEIDSLRKIILCHLRPGYMADSEELTARAKFRYFRDAAEEAISVLLISLADQRATKGPLTTNASRARHEKTVFSLIRGYFRKQKAGTPPRLINGDDLISKFKLEPSILIGKILSEVKELQAIGKIKTKKQALNIAKKFIK